MPYFVGLNGKNYQGHITTTHKSEIFENGLASTHPDFTNSKPRMCPNFVSMPHIFGIGLNRPLYGSHDAPLRWHLTITKAMIRHQFIPMHVDKCVFARHEPSADPGHPLSVNGQIVVALILVHVDDIIYIGDAARLKIFKKCIDEFAHGEFEYLVPGSELKYCGISIAVNKERQISLSQEEFYAKVIPLQNSDFVVEKVIILEKSKVVRRLKSLVGCFIWVMSTRFDIVFGVIQLASLLLECTTDAQKLLEFISIANRLITRLKTKHRPLTFIPFITANDSGRKAQIVAFSDASFGTLRGHGSIEGYCAFFALPVKRDGAVLRRGNLLTYYGRKISRVSRSTAHTEGIALCNASDTTLYLQCLMEEVLSGKFRSSFLRQAEEPVPAISPFREYDHHLDVFAADSHSSLVFPTKNVWVAESWKSSLVVLNCSNCGKSTQATVAGLQHVCDSFFSPQAEPASARPHIYALLVCDCANTNALMSRLNPNPSEKVYRLICAYLYDAQRYINFSFVNAPYNFGDVATKTMSNLSIWHSFLKTGSF